MKRNYIRIIVIAIFLIFLIFLKNKSNKNITYNMETYMVINKIDSLNIQNKCLEELKKREKFMAQIYKCPAGYKTIGYGHKLLKGENYKSIDTIKANEILEKDFNKSLSSINKEFKDSTYKWKLAHAHASFCLGFSKVKKAIKNRDLHKHVYYRKNGKFKKSKSLVEARNFEIAIINHNNQYTR
jgi:lysozyme